MTATAFNNTRHITFPIRTNTVTVYLQPVDGVAGDDGGTEYDNESEADVT